MEEKEIIKQLKELRGIKPNKDWVLLTKGEILRFAQDDRRAQNDRRFFASLRMTAPVGRPAFVLSTLVLVAVVLVGGLFYLESQKVSVVSYENLQQLLAKIISQNQGNEQVIASLGDMQAKLKEIGLSLEDLKNLKNQNQALAMTEIVKATAKEGKEMVKRIKNLDGSLSRQVLASLVEVEDASGELAERTDGVQKELFEAYLADLKQRSLSEEDRERLREVEEHYAEGNMAEAMILITKIGEK